LFLTSISFAQTATKPAGKGTQAEPYQITTLDNLYWLSVADTAWSAAHYYIQTTNIDATGTVTWDSGAGFSCIGSKTIPFNGTYNGQGYTITGIYIYRPTLEWCGFFAYTYGAHISNLGLLNIDITGGSGVGGMDGTSTSYYDNCFVTGEVSGTANVGGFVGYQNSRPINNCYAKVNVTRNSGYTSNFGGFAGYSRLNSSITNCYSTGSVSYLNAENPTDKGFVGYCTTTPVYSNNFFDSETSLQSSDAMGTATPKTTAEMKTLCTFIDGTEASWDFMIETTNGTENIWGMNSTINDGYPFLSCQGYDHTESCCGYLDAEAPTFNSQNTTIYLDNTNNAILNPDSIFSNVFDNCEIKDTVISQTTFDCSNVGVTNVSITITDTSLNATTIQVEVTVLDTIIPVVTCIDNQIVDATSDHKYTVNGTEFDPTDIADNCNSVTVLNDKNNSNTLAGEELAEGNHTIKWLITDNGGNIDSCSFDVTVNAFTSINSPDNNIFVYPNPTTNFVNIESKNLQIEDITITDLAGKTIEKHKLSSGNSKIDISHYKEGVYFIRIKSNEGIFIKKVIKQ